MKFTNDTRRVRKVGQTVYVRFNGVGKRHRGTVIALDKDGIPGVEVRFDRPVNGLGTCYATYGEVRSR